MTNHATILVDASDISLLQNPLMETVLPSRQKLDAALADQNQGSLQFLGLYYQLMKDGRIATKRL